MMPRLKPYNRKSYEPKKAALAAQRRRRYHQPTMKNLSLIALPALLSLPLHAAPPLTLTELGGGTPAMPSPLSSSVVVIIDAQREYVDGRLPLAGVAAALRQSQRLLARARAAGVPVIHIQQVSKPGRGIFDPTGPFVAFAPEAQPLDGEKIVHKLLPNAFAGTTLDEVLKKLGRKDLILSGYMTHMCVSATARAAFDLGYKTTVIADACATRDLPDGFGGTLAAADIHRIALAELADRFSTVVSTLDEIPD
ncbi:MAG TPA: cysteine hydrolase family protein [Candidatus Didemnitutus sp.]|nr:cysteine hydrolase family protein [Candidatus Didemnitutus sp.]